MKIERTELINSLAGFVCLDSGIVSGAPGIGKTYSLKRVRDALLNKDIPTIIIPIDSYLFGNAEEIKQELEIEKNLLNHLKDSEDNNLITNGVIIFDGFDSARDDLVRDNFLKTIEKLLANLKTWKTIVSIRQFDADRNKILLDMFPPRDEHQFSNKKLSCRNFFIPELEPVEVKEAVGGFSSISLDIYDGFSLKFKEILRIPFYLWLLERVIQSSETEQFSPIRSEVQLLDLFWKKKITKTTSKEIFLSKITSLMVKSRKLSLKIDSLDFQYDKSDLDELFQHGIIKKTSLFKSQIAFSHNVLFDYAVAKYSLSQDANEFLNFFIENKVASIFLMPSIQYYFNALWWFDRESFWKNLGIFLSSKEPSIGIMVKAIPFKVIIEESQSIDDVKPILNIEIGVRTNALRFLLFGLNVFNAFKIEDKLLVAKIYKMISSTISKEYAWNLGTGVKGLSDSTDDRDTLFICHKTSRRLYDWVEEHENNPWGKALNSYWCLPVILKTAKYDLKDTKNIIQKILLSIGSDNIDIKMIYHLVKNIDLLFNLGPEIVSKIYITVFSYKENSQDVILLSTPLVSLSSTKKQDYEMCFYLLNQRFDKFLKMYPLPAVKTAILCAEAEVRRKYPKKSIRDKSIESKLLDKKITIDLNNYSFMWDQEKYRDYNEMAIDLVVKATKEMNRLFQEEDREIEPFLECWASSAKLAFSWKKLLEVGYGNPSKMKDYLLSICLMPEILLDSRFEDDISKYLKSVYPYLLNDQKKEIEEMLMSLPDHAKKLNDVHPEISRDRIISSIANLLVTDEAKRHFKSLKGRGRLLPLEKIPSIPTRWRKRSDKDSYSEEDYYSSRGIDLKEGTNQKLFLAKKKILSFMQEIKKENQSNKFDINNKEDEFIALLEESYKFYKDNQLGSLSSELLIEMCKFIDALAFKFKTQKASLYSILKKILLVACKHKEPVFNLEYHSKFDIPGWSTSPRSEGVQGILRLSTRGKDDDIINIIKKLAGDPVPEIRYLVGLDLFRLFLCDKDSFFEISNNIAKTESNGAVLSGLFNSLEYIYLDKISASSKDIDTSSREIDNFDSLDKIADVLQSILPKNLNNHSRGLFINMVVWYLVDPKKTYPWAVDYFNSLKDDLVGNHLYLNSLTLSLCSDLEYRSFLKDEKAFKLAKKYILDLIDSSESTLVDLSRKKSDEKNKSWGKKDQDICRVIDEIIMRLYFNFDFRENNRRFKGIGIPNTENCYKYYKAIEPIFFRISEYCENQEAGLMLAPTAHYFMQLMNIVVEFNPRDVLRFSRKLVQASKKYDYNLDHMAVDEVVKLVDNLLINYKHKIQDQESVLDLIILLDTFAEVGWPEAIKRVWKLDEIFR